MLWDHELGSNFPDYHIPKRLMKEQVIYLLGWGRAVGGMAQWGTIMTFGQNFNLIKSVLICFYEQSEIMQS